MFAGHSGEYKYLRESSRQRLLPARGFPLHRMLSATVLPISGLWRLDALLFCPCPDLTFILQVYLQVWAKGDRDWLG